MVTVQTESWIAIDREIEEVALIGARDALSDTRAVPTQPGSEGFNERA